MVTKTTPQIGVRVAQGLVSSGQRTPKRTRMRSPDNRRRALPGLPAGFVTGQAEPNIDSETRHFKAARARCQLCLLQSSNCEKGFSVAWRTIMYTLYQCSPNTTANPSICTLCYRESTRVRVRSPRSADGMRYCGSCMVLGIGTVIMTLPKAVTCILTWATVKSPPGVLVIGHTGRPRMSSGKPAEGSDDRTPRSTLPDEASLRAKGGIDDDTGSRERVREAADRTA